MVRRAVLSKFKIAKAIKQVLQESMQEKLFNWHLKLKSWGLSLERVIQNLMTITLNLV